MKLRKPIKRKKSLRRSGTTPARKPPPKVNRKRAKERVARTLHSPDRQKFVQTLPCSACGIVGYSQNAHLLGNDGMSRKKSFLTVGPLCGPHFNSVGVGGLSIGCHKLYDEHRAKFLTQFPDFNAQDICDETERAWVEFSQVGL